VPAGWKARQACWIAQTTPIGFLRRSDRVPYSILWEVRFIATDFDVRDLRLVLSLRALYPGVDRRYKLRDP